MPRYEFTEEEIEYIVNEVNDECCPMLASGGDCLTSRQLEPQPRSCRDCWLVYFRKHLVEQQPNRGDIL